MSLFVFFISLLIVAQHVSGNHVPIIRSWRLCDVIASCWYVPWLREGCQVRLAGRIQKVTYNLCVRPFCLQWILEQEDWCIKFVSHVGHICSICVGFCYVCGAMLGYIPPLTIKTPARNAITAHAQEFVDNAEFRAIRANRMHYLLSVYFNK